MATQAIFDQKNVLVTGGAGFIGSHLCDELVKTAKVICVDNFSSGSERNIDHLLSHPNFVFLKADLVEPLDLEERRELERFRVRFQGVQEIYHLACPTSAKQFEAQRVQTALANSLAVKNALDLAVRYKAKFMHASSAVVYGARRDDLKVFREDYFGYVNPIGPRSCYDEGKRYAETLVTTYRDVHQLNVKVARIFRTYGTRMMLDDGQMLPDFAVAALDHKPLVIYGNENFSSTFCHVSDLVAGLIKFMRSGEAGPLNFGSDLEYKLVDVARKIIELTGSRSQVKLEEPLLFMSPLGLPDITAVREKLGWFPVVMLEDGLREVIDDAKANKALVGIEHRAL
ncbi:MAG: GDP-mannose 4,6-dehydratase [Patescibacteria group bacterium]|nr:GDP-mannose 4,6-dehydratase [Patescibacteria group bacterium]